MESGKWTIDGDVKYAEFGEFLRRYPIPHEHPKRRMAANQAYYFALDFAETHFAEVHRNAVNAAYESGRQFGQSQALGVPPLGGGSQSGPSATESVPPAVAGGSASPGPELEPYGWSTAARSFFEWAADQLGHFTYHESTVAELAKRFQSAYQQGRADVAAEIQDAASDGTMISPVYSRGFRAGCDALMPQKELEIVQLRAQIMELETAAAERAVADEDLRQRLDAYEFAAVRDRRGAMVLNRGKSRAQWLRTRHPAPNTQHPRLAA